MSLQQHTAARQSSKAPLKGSHWRATAWYVWLLAAVILLGFFAQGVRRAKQDSVTWDESQHLYSGWLSWTRGDFGFNPEVPPLVKMWDAIPLLDRDMKQPAYTGDPFKREGFFLGREFLAANGMDRTLLPARIMAATLSAMLAALVFLAAAEMFGGTAGLFALVLFCFDPNLLAHSAYVTTDIGASLTVLLATYAFYRYMRRPSIPRMLLVGIAVGLAFTAKFTGVFILPILCIIAGLELLGQNSGGPERAGKRFKQIATALGVALVIGLGMIWSIYHLRYSARPGTLVLNPGSAAYLASLKSPLSREMLLTADRLHLLPQAYLYGLADTKISAGDLPSYFFGRDYSGATHWYFPAAFVIKSTLPLLILLVITVVAVARRQWRPRREIVFLTVPPAFLFLLASSSDLGIGYRHLFPMFPLLYILVAGCARHLWAERPRLAYAFAALLFWQCATPLLARPGLIAYANEAWGGPAKTHRYLSDSNVDWGQQLRAVKAYLDRHPGEPCSFAYFGQGPVDFKEYGVHCNVLPTASAGWLGLPLMHFGSNPNVSGLLLLSDGVVAGADYPGKTNPYRSFQSVEPADTIDRGVYVYRGTFNLGSAAALEHIEAAEKLQEQKHFSEAFAEASLARDLDPESPRAHKALGDALTSSGQLQEAHAEYLKALHSAELDPVFQKGLLAQLQAASAR
jgi:tetratricopeptide (TPR) repeat protein